MTTPADRFGYPDFKGRTILVIDDHPDALDFVAEMLAFCGAKVLKAPLPAHGRAHLKSSTPTPNLIVCDFQMPRESGVDFMRWVRQLPDQRASIPAIAVTGYPPELLMKGDGGRAFDAYFVKPLDPRRFLRTVEAMLSKPQSDRQLAG